MSELTTRTATSSLSDGAPFFEMVGYLFLLICLIILVIWLLKRSHFRRSASGLLSVKATYFITPKERIVVVEIQGEWLVLGVTPQQITLLHKIEQERGHNIESPAPPPAPHSETPPVDRKFAELLKNALKRIP